MRFKTARDFVRSSEDNSIRIQLSISAEDIKLITEQAQDKKKAIATSFRTSLNNELKEIFGEEV